MKRTIIIAIFAAAICGGARAAEPEKETPEPLLQATVEKICDAARNGLDGEAGEIFFNFIMHPAMQRAAAKEAGYDDPALFLAEIKKSMSSMFSTNPLVECKVENAHSAKCPSFATVHFESFGLKAERCGYVSMTSRTSEQDKASTDKLLAGLVEGKWYAVLEDPKTGVDYSEDGENDMGLRDFAKSVCAAMEAQDLEAMKKLAAPALKKASPAEEKNSLAWSAYIARLDKAWAFNPEPVSCSVTNSENFGSCEADDLKAYEAEGHAAATCGEIDLAIFMAKGMWNNELQAVFIDGAWKIDQTKAAILARIDDNK